MKRGILCFLVLFTVLASGPAAYADDPVTINLAEILGLPHLSVMPKAISRTNGDDTTVGFDYRYDRRIGESFWLGESELDLSVRSEGLIVADKERSPNRLLTHGLRLTLINVLPSGREITKHPDEIKQVSDRYGEWLQDHQDLHAAPGGALNDDTISEDERIERMARVLEQAQVVFAPFGEIEVVEDDWKLRRTGEKEAVDIEDVLADKVRVADNYLFASLDAEGSAETDQDFSNVQGVGTLQLRAKLIKPWFDWPFAALRGYRTPKNHLNRNNGPFFWTGFAAVDPTENEARTMIAQTDDVFARLHAGAFFRTELYGVTEERSVAFEILWRFYQEIDAPAGIKRADLEQTSYVKATILFPMNLFLEYSDGKLPIDVAGASAVSAGFRYNF